MHASIHHPVSHSPVLFLGLLSRRTRRPLLPRDQIFDRRRNGNVGEGGQGCQLADAFARHQGLPLFQNVWVLLASANEDVGLERLGEGGVYAFLLGSLLAWVLLAAITDVNLLLISIRNGKGDPLGKTQRRLESTSDRLPFLLLFLLAGADLALHESLQGRGNGKVAEALDGCQLGHALRLRQRPPLLQDFRVLHATPHQNVGLEGLRQRPVNAAVFRE